MRRLPILALIFILGISLSCGGGDDQNSVDGSSLTQRVLDLLQLANSKNHVETYAASAQQTTRENAEQIVRESPGGERAQGFSQRPKDEEVWLVQVSGMIVDITCGSAETCDPVQTTQFNFFSMSGEALDGYAIYATPVRSPTR